MTDSFHTRLIAEHLSTLAGLLEAEAARVHVLGLQCARNLAREAREVREMSDRLWEADVHVAVNDQAAPAQADRGSKIIGIRRARP